MINKVWSEKEPKKFPKLRDRYGMAKGSGRGTPCGDCSIRGRSRLRSPGRGPLGDGSGRGWGRGDLNGQGKGC